MMEIISMKKKDPNNIWDIRSIGLNKHRLTTRGLLQEFAHRLQDCKIARYQSDLVLC